MGRSELQSIRYKDSAKKKKERYLYREEYRGLRTTDMIKQAALDYSDNGRCWWIELKIKEKLCYQYTYRNGFKRSRKCQEL